MIRKAKIKDGQDVLVYAATGAIGASGVQLVKSLVDRMTDQLPRLVLVA